MGHRLSSIVTRSGDNGTTSLADGSRRNKFDSRIHSLGDIDELNAAIGLLISWSPPDAIRDRLLRVQHDLFDIGAELSQPGRQLIDKGYTEALDASIDELNSQLPPLEEFILPGGSPLVSQAHVARTLCRRCERTLCQLQSEEQINPRTLVYINRLSDWLFIAARHIAAVHSEQEIYWQSRFSRTARKSQT